MRTLLLNTKSKSVDAGNGTKKNYNLDFKISYFITKLWVSRRYMHNIYVSYVLYGLQEKNNIDIIIT